MRAISYDVIYYIYILLFGVYISIKISCEEMGKREKSVFLAACPALLLLQGICLQLLGMDRMWMIYPLIAHLPVVLGLIFVLKVNWERALLSVVISYSMCQLTRWLGLVLDNFGLLDAAALILHLSLSQMLLMLLARYCLPSIQGAISSLDHPLLSFGFLPLAYYFYEYFMLFTGRKYSDMQAISEFLPTALVLSFVLFAIVYRREMEKRRSAENLADSLELRLNSSREEINLLRMLEERTAVYRHDLRHHLAMLDSLLSAEKLSQAQEYIREIYCGMDRVMPANFCENETVNLILGAFSRKAQERGIEFQVKANLPTHLNMPEAELCAMLSNGLENALAAAEGLDGAVNFFCTICQNKFLVEIRNPYAGEIIMNNNIPVSRGKEKCYGCRSIQMIVQRHEGVCIFSAEKGIFVLRIAIPVQQQ